MCASRASASTSNGCAYSRAIRARPRRKRARSRRYCSAGLGGTCEIVPRRARVLAAYDAARSLCPMKLAIGDTVVYAAHGVGHVIAQEPRAVGGVSRQMVVVELSEGLTVS